MGSYGFLWVLMDFGHDGSLLVPMGLYGFYEFLWVLMGPCWFLWVVMGSYVSLWDLVYMGPYGFV